MENKDQYFLMNPDKIDKYIGAGNIHPSDTVLELGAGKGTISERMPHCRHLYLNDLDEDLCKLLRHRFGMHSHIDILEMDAMDLLKDLDAEKIFSSLPYTMTDQLLNILRGKEFRRAVICVKSGTDLTSYQNDFDMEKVEHLNGEDFSPKQPYDSDVWLLRKKKDIA